MATSVLFRKAPQAVSVAAVAGVVATSKRYAYSACVVALVVKLLVQPLAEFR